MPAIVSKAMPFASFAGSTPESRMIPSIHVLNHAMSKWVGTGSMVLGVRLRNPMCPPVLLLLPVVGGVSIGCHTERAQEHGDVRDQTRAQSYRSRPHRATLRETLPRRNTHFRGHTPCALFLSMPSSTPRVLTQGAASPPSFVRLI